MGRIVLTMIICAATLATVAGCSSSQETCADLRRSYQSSLQQNVLQQNQPSGAQHTLMATQIHEDTLGDLIEQALKRKGTLSHKVKRTLPGMSKLDLQVTWTRLSFALTPECANCIQVTSGLKGSARITAAGIPIANQKATGQLVGLLPLRLTSDASGSRLTTDLRKMTLKKINLRIPGLPREASALIEPLARSAVHGSLERLGGNVTLTRWKPITVPGAKFKVHARQMKVFAPKKTVWIGWGADIPLTPGALELTPTASLAKGDAAAISFTGPALTALMQAMQTSGAVPSRLNQDLKPDKNGDVYINLNRVTPTADGLKTEFTAWSLPDTGGTCYQVAMEADTNLTIAPPQKNAGTAKERRGDVTVKLDNMQVVQTSGDDTMLRMGLWLRSLFVEETMEAQTRLLAAHDFDIGGGKLDVALQRAETQGDAITLYMKPSWTPK